MKNVAEFTKKIVEMYKKGQIFSVIFIAVFVFLVLSTIFTNPQLYRRRMYEGDIAVKDTYAPYDFNYKWGVDVEKTQEAKDKIEEMVPYVFGIDNNILEKDMTEAYGLIDLAGDIMSGEDDLQEKLSALKKGSGIKLSDRYFRALLEYPDKNALKREVSGVLEKILKKGFISDAGLDVTSGRKAKTVILHDSASGDDVEKTLDDVVDSRSLSQFIDENIPDGDAKDLAGELAKKIVNPNLVFDKDRSDDLLKKRKDEVNPHYHIWTVKKNEIIIGKGERVSARHVEQFSTLNDLLKRGKSGKFFAGTLGLIFMMVFFVFIYLSMVRHTGLLENVRSVGMILINMLLMIVASNVVIKLPQPSYFIPLASMGMLLMLLIGFELTFISVVLMSIYVSVLAGGQVAVTFVLLAGTFVGIFSIRGARKRVSILWAGLLVGASKSLAIVVISLMNGIDTSIFLSDAVSGFYSGVISGVIVMGLLPLFEFFFKVPTNISLLEISDLNHPVLKRLAMEAPGTYHHSIVVGNLAEAACDQINANSLLARVGAYYHDIGKISKPQYFSENEMGEKSKHTGLTPSMSALIISNHVKEGVELANKYKLNDTIVDFIKQHHGDSLIAYFYQKALEKSKDDSMPDEKNFRYPGPRPQTKEAAIVLLADAVEASSRSLSEPTPSSIRNLVRKVINNKFIDGQLDGCDLTLKDMHNISDSFVRTLVAIFHTRTSYPENNGTSGKRNK